jgi:hypothetical protein
MSLENTALGSALTNLLAGKPLSDYVARDAYNNNIASGSRAECEAAIERCKADDADLIARDLSKGNGPYEILTGAEDMGRQTRCWWQFDAYNTPRIYGFGNQWEAAKYTARLNKTREVNQYWHCRAAVGDADAPAQYDGLDLATELHG